MKINNNISALVANNKLQKTQNNLAQSVERLSSGLKINHASDNPAGMAISQKMRTQIRGLSRASDNALDGISVIETAEGALSEVQSMLQRMRELAVQAANDTNDEVDRDSIQEEISSLQEEIDRISKDTEFNKTALLDGSVDYRGYTDKAAVKISTFTEEVDAGEYKIQVNQAGSKAETTFYMPSGNVTDAQAGIVNINGLEISLEAGDTPTDVYNKMLETAKYANLEVTAAGSVYRISTKEYGSDEAIKVTSDNLASVAYLGMTEGIRTGTDAKITLMDGFANTASYVADGNTIHILDRGNFDMEVKVAENVVLNDTVTMDVMSIGGMILQIGANEGQTMQLKIPEISSESLGIQNIGVYTNETASDAITKLDAAIETVSAVRSQLGAYQNRLDHAIASLDLTEENMTTALSRIEDLDMAEEMTEYTQQNVLQQAGVSVLAQANDLPQMALQLLQ